MMWITKHFCSWLSVNRDLDANKFYNVLLYIRDALLPVYISIPPAQGSVARVILFSVVSVCPCVRMFVCQHDNSWTVRDIITKIPKKSGEGHSPLTRPHPHWEGKYPLLRPQPSRRLHSRHSKPQTTFLATGLLLSVVEEKNIHIQ